MIATGHRRGEDSHRLVVIPWREQTHEGVAQILPGGTMDREVMELEADLDAGVGGYRQGPTWCSDH